SGHPLDDYSDNISVLGCDRISDIVSAFADDSASDKYTDKATVKIAGIISQKRLKAVKNGDSMAFVKLEDRYGELEAIIFPKQFKKVASLLSEDAAVYAEGTLSVEDDDVRVIITDIRPLADNDSYSATKETCEKKPTFERTAYIKLQNLSDTRLSSLTRMSLLYPGKSKIVLYDAQSGKYVGYKGCTLSLDENVIARLKSTFGEANVVIK
ncbi:MAG: hypothetical protein IKY62_05275, partial [Clostridia bacterium]|nr:hypothetical protein [Clostridia bacterium]